MTTLTELKSDIADWLERDDLTDSQLNKFVLMAERQIWRILRCAEMIATQSIPLTPGTDQGLPDELLMVRSVSLEGAKLKPMSRDYVVREAAAPHDTPVTPRYYSTQGRSIFIAPGSDAKSFSIMGYYRPAYLSVTATNPVLVAHYDIFLYACLMVANHFLKMEDESAKWGQAMAQSIELANATAINNAGLTGGGD